MKVEEFNTFPSDSRQNVKDEWRDIVAELDKNLSEAFKDFISNPIQLTELAETKILPILRYSGEDWMSPLNEYALPDEWVFAYVVKKVIPALRENLASGIMSYKKNPALTNHPRIEEATDLYKSLGTYHGRDEAVKLILAAKTQYETMGN